MSNDTFIVQRGIVGKGEGDDIYVFSSNLVDSNAEITITDTQGSNSLQFIGGLSITSSIVASDTVQLTLSNGATVTILGASSMSYTIGGDPVAGTAGVDKDFATFVSDILSTTVPTSGTSTGGSADINSDGSATVVPPTDTGGGDTGGGDTGGGSDSLLTQAQAKSSTNATTGTLPTTGDSPALESGVYWTGKSNITYSYNLTEPADYAGENLSGFIAFPDAAKPSVESSFTDIATFTPLTFSEVSVDGDIEWNAIAQSGNTDAYAYYPGSGIGGDVFLNNEYTTSEQYTAGQSPFFTVIHELGHAMGLDHSFEGDATLPASEENITHSVMSYTDYHNYTMEFTLSGNSINSQSVGSYYTTGYALYDVMALQAAYGVNTSHNSTDTTYTVGFGTTVQEVIWDAGGTDLIDASAATGVCTVDLREQTFSSIDIKDAATQAAEKVTEMGITSQTFINFINDQYTNLGDQLYTGEMNLAITKGVVIENVTTGSANDSVQDNAVDNVISTGAGDDIIILNQGGFDTVNGGTGTDTVQLSIASSAAQVEKQTDGSYIVLADSFAAQLTGVENLQFTDTTTTLV